MAADAATDIMRRVFQRQTSSLLQYAHDVWPWVSASEQEPLQRLARMISEQETVTRHIADFLQRRRVPALSGQFPEFFTTINYISLEHLLPRLAADERAAIADLEWALTRFTDPEARPLVQHLLDLKRRQAAELDQLGRDLAGRGAVSTLR